MSKNFAREYSQAGQTAVLFALMIVGLVAFIGLAVDGGSVFSARRVVQNGADSAALTGVHYMIGSNAPTEKRLQEVVNSVVEANGVADTDGDPGNHINENITIYYTDEDGELISGCNEVPCGEIPLHALGLEVMVDHQVDTYFLGIINRDRLDVGADAVAVATGGFDGGGIGDNALHAFGVCEEADKPLDISSHYVDFIGGVHSNSFWENRGGEEGGELAGDSSNHYHGQATYGGDEFSPPTISEPGVFEPDPPGRPITVTTTSGDPFVDADGNPLFTINDFKCDGSIGGAVGDKCYDLTVFAAELDNTYRGEINTRFLRDYGYLDGTEMEEGLYYGGEYPFRFGVEKMSGNVTIVTSNTIKITENDIHLHSFLDHETVIDGLLFFSSYAPDEGPCANFPDVTPPIDTTGGDAEDGEALPEGSMPPRVKHDEEGGQHCLYLPEGCRYKPGTLYYYGLIYAPYGRVAASGHGATYVGAIVAPTIRINGYLEDGREGTDGEGYDNVGALFVANPNLFPASQQLMSLEK